MPGGEQLKRIVCSVWSMPVLIVLGCVVVWAQATAQISGTATDQSGAVMPGVEVTVTHTDTGTTRTTITNETGSYVLPTLAIGPYRLEAALPGFRTFVRTGVVLQVGSNPVINVGLEVGQVSETVEVQANGALVETRNVGIGQVVENARILELPLDGRQVVELIALAGAATPSAYVVNAGGRDPFGRASFSVAGGLSTGLAYFLDGALHNNAVDGGHVAMPFPDALQEFKVETSASGAQGGVKSAGSVSLVTKSGTNQFHGNLFEFVRNYGFNARNAFATRRDSIKRNQFGGTLGGPIIEKKIFFFAGYQGTLVRQEPSDTITFVPTEAMMRGDFTAFAGPGCNGGRQITLGAPFAGNRVDPALFSKAALALTSKLPSTPDACGKLTYGNPSREDDHQAIGRIDYQHSERHSLFGRYLIESIVRPSGFIINKNPLSINSGDDGLAQAFTVGSTYLFSSGVVNQLRLTADRVAAGRFPPIKEIIAAGLTSTALGIRAYNYDPTALRTTVTGGFNVGAQGGTTRTALFAINDDVSVLRGSHQLAFGVSAAMSRVNNYSTQQTVNYGFNGFKTGLGMPDFFLGYAQRFINGPASATLKTVRNLGVYSSDTWKLNPKLTVSYGLRWEPYFPMTNRDGVISHFDIDAMRKGVRSGQFDNTPPGMSFIGDPGFPGLGGMYNQWMNFSPRLGLAWDVAGDGHTSVRASVGTFYDFPHTQYYSGNSAVPPQFPRYLLNDVSYDDPWSRYPGGDPFPMPYGRSAGRSAAWPLYALVYAMDYDTPNMRVAQWNLSVQRQIGNDWLASASYLGSNTIHVWSVRQLNNGVFLGTDPCTINGVRYATCSTQGNLDQRRKFSLENPAVGQHYGYVVKQESGGTAGYNGMLLSVQRQAGRAVTVSANYTWSHCIADPGAGTLFGVTGTFNNGWTDTDNRRFDRGNCSEGATDRRHLFNLSGVAETPEFSNPRLRAVASGWKFSPIFRVLSGGYLTVTTSQDRAMNGMINQRVSLLQPNPYGDKSAARYLNPGAFAMSALGTLGSLGMASIAGPGTWQFDAAISRAFQFGETRRVEFRAEAFNVTNSVRLNDPVVNFNAGNFGQVASARDPRIMQFALKYIF